MRVITVNTNLMKKEEVFKILALAESLQAPVLLIGDPGTGKTNAVLDYAKASVGASGLTDDDVFVLETDESTHGNAVKGNVDMKKMLDPKDPTFQRNSPITRAKFVVINEVDKASADLRNSLLGIMNEKILFDGDKKVNCEWTTFVATCNKIPDDEVDSPFWDRFLITFQVNRMSQSNMLQYYKKGAKKAGFKYDLNLPEQVELDAMVVPVDKLKKVMDCTYDKLSDRSLTFIPVLARHISGVWGTNISRSLVKAVELLISKEQANILAKSIVSRELRNLYDKIDRIDQMSNYKDYKNLVTEIDNEGEVLKKTGKLDKIDIADIIRQVSEKSDRLEFLNEDDDAMDAAANQVGV
jgi:hypothetical protein